MLHQFETTSSDLMAVVDDCIKDLISSDIKSYNKCPDAYDIELWASRMDTYKLIKDVLKGCVPTQF